MSSPLSVVMTFQGKGTKVVSAIFCSSLDTIAIQTRYLDFKSDARRTDARRVDVEASGNGKTQQLYLTEEARQLPM
jgi:hypothetical protein